MCTSFLDVRHLTSPAANNMWCHARKDMFNRMIVLLIHFVRVFSMFSRSFSETIRTFRFTNFNWFLLFAHHVFLQMDLHMAWHYYLFKIWAIFFLQKLQRPFHHQLRSCWKRWAPAKCWNRLTVAARPGQRWMKIKTWIPNFDHFWGKHDFRNQNLGVPTHFQKKTHVSNEEFILWWVAIGRTECFHQLLGSKHFDVPYDWTNCVFATGIWKWIQLSQNEFPVSASNTCG